MRKGDETAFYFDWPQWYSSSGLGQKIFTILKVH